MLPTTSITAAYTLLKITLLLCDSLIDIRSLYTTSANIQPIPYQGGVLLHQLLNDTRVLLCSFSQTPFFERGSLYPGAQARRHIIRCAVILSSRSVPVFESRGSASPCASHPKSILIDMYWYTSQREFYRHCNKSKAEYLFRPLD